MDAVLLQREYYRSTAAHYDSMRLGDQEHELALALMLSAIRFFDIKSVLDVGSGTGRAPIALKAAFPSLRVVGIEPSLELREPPLGRFRSLELPGGSVPCSMPLDFRFGRPGPPLSRAISSRRAATMRCSSTICSHCLTTKPFSSACDRPSRSSGGGMPTKNRTRAALGIL